MYVTCATQNYQNLTGVHIVAATLELGPTCGTLQKLKCVNRIM